MQSKRSIHESLASIECEGLESYFRERPQDVDTKRGIELLVGCVLARTFEQLDGYLPRISVPVHRRRSEPPTIRELIADKSLHTDGSVDLYIKFSDGKSSPVDVTRLEEHHTGDKGTEGLINLLRRKSKRASDGDMILAVLLDVNEMADLDEVIDFLESSPFPYGIVLLLGQFGPETSLGRFQCQMIHPKNCNRIEVQLDWQ